MMHVFACATGLAIGLYAGKKRERGDGWGKISCDLCSDTIGVAKAMWRRVSGPFMKGDPKPEA